jgi:xanthine dehydrogenase accessory factor
MAFLVVVRGGGDLASGVILRLAKAGIRVVVTELPRPLAVRRSVSFAQAVYSQRTEIEGVRAQLARGLDDLHDLFANGIIPVLVDPDATCLGDLQPQVVVDARMRKRPPELAYPSSWFSIGLGPGFVVGENCDAAVETKRGHFLGRVYWQGSPEPDTGRPEKVGDKEGDRVIRAPRTGHLVPLVKIGEIVQQGTPLARVDDEMVTAHFPGIIRGMLMEGLHVDQGMKIGDLDPRNDPKYCVVISDKALAVGGGVMEAILSRNELREKICSTG